MVHIGSAAVRHQRGDDGSHPGIFEKRYGPRASEWRQQPRISLILADEDFRCEPFYRFENRKEFSHIRNPFEHKTLVAGKRRALPMHAERESFFLESLRAAWCHSNHAIRKGGPVESFQ